MSYIINKTDGTVLTEVVDGTIDQVATDITLVGKNATTYGELFNENFVKILENFANTSQPNNPIQGQLWYDTSEGRLKVYDGSGFKVSGGTIVSNSAPSSIAQGDIWIDSLRQQMYFNDGTATVLAGPIYTAQQGVTGFQSIDVIDTNSINHTVLFLYVGQTLLGIFSKDAFTPNTTIPGFSGNVEVGFNVSSFSGIKFNVPVTQADSLVSQDGILKTVESFVSTTDDSSMLGTLSVLSDTPLILGANQSNEIKISTSAFSVNSNIANQNFEINLLNNGIFTSNLFIDANNNRVGLYTKTPTATLDVNGSVKVRGDLTVEGNVTTVNTTNVEISDKLIELAKVDTPSNATATGGGISVAGGSDGDKTLTWEDATNSWTSSENFNLAVGKAYSINGFNVLSQTSLGATVTSAPGLTSLGTLTTLQVSNLTVTSNTVSYTNPSISDGDIILAPKGSGTVSVNNAQVSNLANPVNNTDAANLQTVITYVETAPLGLSINATGLSDAQIISTILNKIYPPVEHQDNTICRVWCIDLAAAKQFTLISGAWSFTANI